jgi:hypothetical protein
MKKLMEGWKRFLNEDLRPRRVRDAKKKYPDHAEYIDAMSADARLEDANNKYLMWMAKQLNAGGSNPDEITDLVSKFHKNVQRLEKKDIYQYKSLDELVAALEKLGPSLRQKREKEKYRVDEPELPRPLAWGDKLRQSIEYDFQNDG